MKKYKINKSVSLKIVKTGFISNKRNRMLHMVHMVHGALRCTQTTVKVINQIFRESYFKVSQHLDTLIFCSPRHKHFKNATCFFIVYSLKEVIGKILINFCVRVCTS